MRSSERRRKDACQKFEANFYRLQEALNNGDNLVSLTKTLEKPKGITMSTILNPTSNIGWGKDTALILEIDEKKVTAYLDSPLYANAITRADENVKRFLTAFDKGIQGINLKDFSFKERLQVDRVTALKLYPEINRRIREEVGGNRDKYYSENGLIAKTPFPATLQEEIKKQAASKKCSK